MLHVPRATTPRRLRDRALIALRRGKLLQIWQDAGLRLMSFVWKWRWGVAALLTLVCGLGYLAVPALLGPIVHADVVVHSGIVQSVVASGHVEAPFRVNIGSQIIGVVIDVPVAEGQWVKAGDTLVVLDDHEAQAGVVQADGVLAQAEARLRQMRELTLPSAEQALQQAQATLRNAQQVYDRVVKLANKGVATTASLDDATRALDIARAQVASAELQVFTSRQGGSDYVMAQMQLKQAQAAVATARARLAYTIITAPRDGVLISRDVERGNIVQPANVLMKLSPAGETQLVVQIDEKNLRLIAIGQPALASADAFPNDVFGAEVVYINPGVDLQRASVEVRLKVAAPPPFLRQDMTISVDIETATRANALVVPTASLRGGIGSRPWVLKVAAGRATRQPVKLGIVGAGKAEVLGGLLAGDLVIPSTTPLKDGARLRARARAPTISLSSQP